MAGIEDRIKGMAKAIKDNMGERDRFFLVAFEDDDVRQDNVQVVSNLISKEQAIALLDSISVDLRKDIKVRGPRN